MEEPQADGYDLLSSRLVAEHDLRMFLLDCFDVAEHELFVGRADLLDEGLREVPRDAVFAAFCTYSPAAGHFAMSVDLGVEGRLAGRVGRREFAERFAGRFDAYVLYGHDEPPGLWTVVLPNGDRLLTGMEEGEDGIVLHTATAPIPGVSGIRVTDFRERGGVAERLPADEGQRADADGGAPVGLQSTETHRGHGLSAP